MMSKKLRLATQGCSPSPQPLQWDVCVLCQVVGGTHVQPTRAGYAALASNLTALHELHSLPLNIIISRFDDGGGIEETLATHKAKWHKSCYVLCNATKVDRARKRHDRSENTRYSPLKQHLRSANTSSCYMDTGEEENRQPCFFCDDSTGELHNAETMALDAHVRSIATDLRDTKLLAKLSSGDMVATDARYHVKCLAAFYNRHRSQQRHSVDKCCELNPQSLALAELVSYVEEYAQLGTDCKHIFKLSDLRKLYCEYLQNLGGDPNVHVHSTRLAQKLQEHIPGLETHQSKAGTVLSFKEDVGDALLNACNIDSDEKAVMLMRVAKLIRKKIFETKYTFSSSLCDEQYDNLPPTLCALIGMILDNSAARQHGEDNISTAASSITQLLVFNAVKRGRQDAVSVRHNRERETALPLYLGLLLHNKTQKRELIDNLFDKGLSVSYRVLQLSTEEANRAIDMYEIETVYVHQLFETTFLPLETLTILIIILLQPRVVILSTVLLYLSHSTLLMKTQVL